MKKNKDAINNYILISLYLCTCFLSVNAQENIDVSMEKFTKSGHTMIRVIIKNNNSFDMRIMNLAYYSHQGEIMGHYPSSYMQLIANPTITIGNINYIPEYYSQAMTQVEWDSFLSQYTPEVLPVAEWESISSRYSAGLYLNGTVISNSGAVLSRTTNAVSSNYSSVPVSSSLGNTFSVSASTASSRTAASSSTEEVSSPASIQSTLIINSYSKPILFDGTINPMGTNVIKHIDIKKGRKLCYRICRLWLLFSKSLRCVSRSMAI